VEYTDGLELQRTVRELRSAGAIPDTLILLEHPPVVTLGKHASSSNLLVSESVLSQRGIQIIRTERGGDVTFHGPGQLVGYPVFRLRSGLVGVRRYVELVQQALVRALADVGVAGSVRRGYVGVWSGEKKIASIGVAVRQGITFHGFALNVRTDLSHFELMRPCGIADVQMTSMLQEGGDSDLETVAAAVVSGFEQVFGLRFQRNLPRSLTSLTKGLSDSAMASASDNV
jgi:lipoate-protein ligase B